ncbi:uncharacterized protein V1516DRAFT_678114 [Lipomyces oligophaga]|uniref:uncharacterized protein n=1 Tax=Lipomyces oligophaga TaxID=45792 RepID=UPI0034CEBA45
MGKKDKKNKKDDYWDVGFEDDMETAQPEGFGADIGADAKVENVSVVSAQDSTNDSSINRAAAPHKETDEPEDEPEESVPIVQLKSKKEKEREKKEKEKLRKKQQLERKKAAASTVPAESLAKPSNSSNPEISDAPILDSAPPAKKGSKADAKSKKKNSVLAALEKQVEARRVAEAERKRAEEEERKRIEEEERAAAEEERMREEARQKKKEKEKAKRDELRKEGKLLTKKQKEQLAFQQKRAQQLRDSGVVIAGFSNNSDELKSKKPFYGKKKKNSSQAKEESESTSLEISIADLADSEEKSEPMKEHEEEVERDELTWEDALNDELLADKPTDKGESWETLLEDSDHDDSGSDSVGSSTQKTEVSEDDKKAVEVIEEEENDPDKFEQTESAKAKESEKLKFEASQRRDKRHQAALSARSKDNLRSPICCILGHVDTGKTKLLDKVRQTNVQEGEAGGITQQIGATYFPIEAIKMKTQVVNKDNELEFKVPGLLIIDTPGHESFTNLRSRGSSLCNIAILVIDIMHGLEQQTLESIRLLRQRKTPFIVALNKIDRLYGWESIPDNGFQDSLAKQPRAVQREFEDRLQKTKLALAEQGLNSELYYKNRNMARNVSLVPTSAVTGEGVPDMLKLLIELTQNRMSDKLMYLSELECTVLEVKVIEGLGTTIDVVLSNGILREGDRIVLCGMNGPIATNVRALLTPQPLREMRIKSAYVHHKEVKAALGVKIAANDLEKAIAGSRLLLVGPEDDEEDLMDEVMSDLTSLNSSLDKSGKGVCVQASTLGSLEALLDFLKQMKIPVMSISIGPVYKRDVMKATAMLEKAREFAVMLCFDVKIDKEAEEYAEQQGIRIFSADIIYHLFDAFTNYQKELLEAKRKDTAENAVFPCVLHTIKVINKRNPMIIGVDVIEGSVRVGTPIATVRIDPATQMRQVLELGRVASLEVNHKSLEVVKKGQAHGGVAMRLDTPANQPTWGRHVDETDILYSHISRDSIDTLKDPAYRDDVTRDEWLLIRNLKSVFSIL